MRQIKEKKIKVESLSAIGGGDFTITTGTVTGAVFNNRKGIKFDMSKISNKKGL
ncbi:hypothetical protein KJ781_04385 [Patescibacteria group bacterium]|nr:hypothetical protein [Patescibacteria group bacterium]MBU1449077.1 hypothetical protein [Patescibacteria group bacterium]